MAKDKERKTARILYVEQRKTAKYIAELVGVSEKTVANWIQKYGWKAARNAKVTSSDNQIMNIKQIINDFAQDRIDLQAELKDISATDGDKERISEIRQDMARIDAGVANWNKTLAQVDDESKITLSTYLNIMDKIFDALRDFDVKTYMQTVPFQEFHINEKSSKY